MIEPMGGLNKIVPSSPTAGSINDILSKASGGNTFDKTTDSLEALRDKLNSMSISALILSATCDVGMTASTTTIVSVVLAGYGDDYFNGKFWIQVIKNANSVGNDPERQYRQIIDYVSATGTFTVSAFSANVEASDEIIVIHESLVPLKYYEYTSGSGNWTVPSYIYSVDVLIVGGGGGGGGVSTNGNRGGGGGGGGEVVILRDFKVRMGEVFSYVVGAGGTGGAAGDNDGTNGNSSSFGGIVASGGLKGSKASVSTGGNGGSTTTGGAGGAAATAGGNGSEAGSLISRIGGGGGGGGGDSSSGTGKAGGSGLQGGGAGANTTGGGGGGGGSFRMGAIGGSDANGANAVANSGGGGGGAGEYSTSLSYAGGNGGSGYVLIYWR